MNDCAIDDSHIRALKKGGPCHAPSRPPHRIRIARPASDSFGRTPIDRCQTGKHAACNRPGLPVRWASQRARHDVIDYANQQRDRPCRRRPGIPPGCTTRSAWRVRIAPASASRSSRPWGSIRSGHASVQLSSGSLSGPPKGGVVARAGVRLPARRRTSEPRACTARRWTNDSHRWRRPSATGVGCRRGITSRAAGACRPVAGRCRAGRDSTGTAGRRSSPGTLPSPCSPAFRPA